MNALTPEQRDRVDWRERIKIERQRQIAKGFDADHDAKHGVDHLLTWAQDYARKGEPLAAAALIEAARELLAPSPDKTGTN